MLLIKTRQKSQQNPFYRELLLKLNRSSTQTVSVENYEIRNSRSDCIHIPMDLILTILDIYKDYFKSRHEVIQSDNTCILWLEAEIALVHHSLCRSYYAFTLKVLWPRSFMIFIIDELKNFATNNLPQVGKLIMYWNLCIID